MPRPRRGTSVVWLDTFADMPIEDQAACMRLCEEIHRQAKRAASRKPKTEPEAPTQEVLHDGE